MEINKIHNQFHNLLHNYIVARVNDSDDAADILQEVFIKIASKLSSLTDGEKLKNWILLLPEMQLLTITAKMPTIKKQALQKK